MASSPHHNASLSTNYCRSNVLSRLALDAECSEISSHGAIVSYLRSSGAFPLGLKSSIDHKHL